MTTKLAIPSTTEELQDMLNDRGTMRNVLADPELTKEWLNNSVTARLKNDPSIINEQKEQFELFLTNWLKGENKDLANSVRLNFGGGTGATAKAAPNTVYNKAAMGAKYDNYFASAGDFMRSISDHVHVDAALSQKLGTLKNDMSSIKPSDGGFLIPENLRAELLAVALENAIVRSRARVIPMDTLRVPFPTVDSTSNASSVFGGVVGYWTEEGATLTESKPRFGRVVLQANKLTLYVEVPNELIADSKPAMDAYIGQIFPEALAWFEDIAFFIGNGVGEPLGFLNAPAAVSVTRSTVVAGTNVEWIDLANMYARMIPSSLARAVWVVSPDVVPSLLTMTVGNIPIWLRDQSGAGNVLGSILGAPVVISEKAKAVGTTGDINLVDFGHYLVGDRQAMSARQSEDFRFNEDVTAFRVIERVDGRPWLNSAITPQNGGSTLSPFVKLTTSV